MNTNFVTKSDLTRVKNEIGTSHDHLQRRIEQLEAAQRKAGRDTFSAQMRAMTNRITIKLGALWVFLVFMVTIFLTRG